MRFCLAPHCPECVEGRDAYCPEHAPKQVWRKTTSRSVSGWEWSRIRRRILRRANYSCQWPGCAAPATEVDHILPVSQGGSEALDNLRALCPPHHRDKSEAERLAGLRGRR